MKITVLSGNQPRHIALANRLSEVADEVFYVAESGVTFHSAFASQRSDIMRQYFSFVEAAEKKIFGETCFTSPNVRTLPIRAGELNFLTKAHLSPALQSDLYVVFGSSFIKGWLVEELVRNAAINIHIGVSPYYRGSACNFWAVYDGNPEYVGATIHDLTRGIDDGDILFHAMPLMHTGDTTFDFTMRAVSSAHDGLIKMIRTGKLTSLSTQKQDRQLEIRYSRSRDFTDEIASEFLARPTGMIQDSLAYPNLVEPHFS